MVIKKALLLISLILSSSLCAQEYNYEIPEQGSDGWRTGNISSNGIEVALFEKFLNALNAQNHKLHSMLIIKNNKLVFEEYFNDYTKDKRQDLRSTTKSVISLLVGIALEQGIINSIDDPISQYLEEFNSPKNPDPRKSKITLRHLMNMSSGMECNDWDPKSKGQEDKLYKKKNWIQFMANLPMASDPGTNSFYCTGGVILTAEIIERTSGMPLNEYAQKYLFNPLGISDLNWGHTNKKKVIMAGQRLYMLPRDMAKIGQLLLNKGSWNNKQIIPEQWVDNISEAETQITGLGYGLLWWKLPFFIKDSKRVTSVDATGNGGQYILTFPEYDLIAIFTGGAYNSSADKLPFTIVNKVILPSLKN